MEMHCVKKPKYCHLFRVGWFIFTYYAYLKMTGNIRLENYLVQEFKDTHHLVRVQLDLYSRETKKATIFSFHNSHTQHVVWSHLEYKVEFFVLLGKIPSCTDNAVHWKLQKDTSITQLESWHVLNSKQLLNFPFITSSCTMYMMY